MNRKKYPLVLIGLIFPLVLMVVLSGCASVSSLHRRGMAQFRAGNYDQAVKTLQRAYKEKPKSDIQVTLFRAQLSSYYDHLAKARNFRDSNQKEAALKEYQLALAVFPGNTRLQGEMDEYLEVKKEKPQQFVSTIKAPVTLKLNSNEKMTLNLRNTPITKIYKVVGKAYGINFIFDKDFRDFVYSIDIEGIGFYEIMNQLGMIGSTEYRVLDQSSVLIYPNSTFKKRTFGLKGVKIFHLANTKAEEAKKLLMTVFREQQIQVQEDVALNTLIVKTEFVTLQEIERFLYSIDKRKSEVYIDIQILEVTKNLLNAMGVNLGDTTTALSKVSGGFLKNTTDSNGNITGTTVDNVLPVKMLNQTEFIATIPSAAVNFLESVDKNKIIAKPNLRGIDGEEIKFMVGDEVPVPQTQFQSGAAGGVQNVPVTTYQYKNVGVEVKVTPYIHTNNEVTLKIKLTINSIAGYENDFPIFGKRELENVIRLKEGETNIIGGFIRDEIRKGVKGIPGFSRLPLIGKLFGISGDNVKQTDLIFSITPRIIHRAEVTDIDRQTIWSDTPPSGPGGMEIPMPEVPPEMQQSGEDEGQREEDSNALIISPAKRRSPVNAVSFFTIRLNSQARLASLSVSGTVTGGKAVIEEVKTDFFGPAKVDVLKNSSESAFDLGFSFPPEDFRPNVIAQLKVKFIEKGNYTINLSNLTAITKDRQSVDMKGTTAEIEVY